MNHDVKDSIDPVFNSLCPAVLYLPEIRSSVSDTLFNLVTGKSLYSFRNTSSHDQLFDNIVHIMKMSYQVGPEILSVARSDKSQSRFVPTQQTLLEIPVVCLYSHPFTL